MIKYFLYIGIVVVGVGSIIAGILWIHPVSPEGVSIPSQPNTVAPSTSIGHSSSSLVESLLQQRWLVFFQNPYELRSTGGFWGTIGSLERKNDGTFDYWVKDVYAIDGPALWNDISMPSPPHAIKQYIGIDSWYLRDANWDADFATSAQRALALYDLETGSSNAFDGVIAINPDILKDILALTGPMTVDGIRFTADSIVETIIDAVEIDYRKKGIPQSKRKDILHHLVDAIIHDRRSTSIALTLLKQLPDYQQRKIIQLYARDPKIQQQLVESGWSGTLAQSTDDYVLIADNNYAALKTDRVITRSTNYSVTRTPQQTRSILRLSYQNNATAFDYRTTRYRTFTRVYVPLGAVLESHHGARINDRLKDPQQREGPVSTEIVNGKTVFGFFTSVEPGKTTTVELTYAFPTSTDIDPDTYTLVVGHQSGVVRRPLTTSIRFGTTSEPIVIQRDGAFDEFISVKK